MSSNTNSKKHGCINTSLLIITPLSHKNDHGSEEAILVLHIQNLLESMQTVRNYEFPHKEVNKREVVKDNQIL